MASSATAASASPIGDVIGGRYAVERRIGEGGMAEVFLARDQRAADAPVVIKRCRAHLAYQPEFATLFLREARLASLIHHPNVVELTDTGDDNGLPYLVMEYLRGFNVRDIFVRAPKVAGVPQDVAAAIILGSASGLHAAHVAVDEKGQPMRLVHRDVSPHNLFVTEEGTIKVLDFGIAKGVNDTTTTRAGHVKGKASYLAPEQLVPDTKVDARTDLFTLGIVAWELFTGKRLFKRATELDTINAIKKLDIENPRKIEPKLDEAYASTVQRLLARVPSARPASAELVATELASALARRLNVPAGDTVALGRACAELLADFVARVREIAAPAASGEVPIQPTLPPRDKAARKKTFEEAWGLQTQSAEPPKNPPAETQSAAASPPAVGQRPPGASAPSTGEAPSESKTAAATPMARPEESTHTVAPPVADAWHGGAPQAGDGAASEAGLRIAGAVRSIDASGGYAILDGAVRGDVPPPPPPPPPPWVADANEHAAVPTWVPAWVDLEPSNAKLAAYLAGALVAGLALAFALTSLFVG